MDVPEIDIHAAKEALDDKSATFVDIRDPHSHAAARVPGCRHLASEEDVDTLCEQVSKDERLIVYCYHGNSSKGATMFLKERGFTDVHSMSGGFEAWRSLYDVEA